SIRCPDTGAASQNRPWLVGSGATSQRRGANPSNGNPGSSGTGPCAHGVGEHRTRVDEIVWGAAAELWHQENASGNGPGNEPGIEGYRGSANRSGQIVKTA